jgi:hypothetical protein
VLIRLIVGTIVSILIPVAIALVVGLFYRGDDDE